MNRTQHNLFLLGYSLYISCHWSYFYLFLIRIRQAQNRKCRIFPVWAKTSQIKLPDRSPAHPIISSLTKSCFLSIRDLHRICNTLGHSTAQTIATSLLHSTVNYCNSLFLNLPHCQLDQLQLNLNSAAQIRLFLKPLGSAIFHPSQIFTLA